MERGRIQRLPKFFGYPLLSQERIKLRTSNLVGTFRGSMWTKAREQDGTILVALFCTFSIFSVRPILWGDHAEFENSKWLLTIDLYNKTNASFPMWSKFLLIIPQSVKGLNYIQNGHKPKWPQPKRPQVRPKWPHWKSKTATDQNSQNQIHSSEQWTSYSTEKSFNNMFLSCRHSDSMMSLISHSLSVNGDNGCCANHYWIHRSRFWHVPHVQPNILALTGRGTRRPESHAVALNKMANNFMIIWSSMPICESTAWLTANWLILTNVYWFCQSQNQDGFEASMLEAKAKPSGVRGQGQWSSGPRLDLVEARPRPLINHTRQANSKSRLTK